MLPKKFRFISSAALVVLGLIIAVVAFTRHGQIQASAAEKPAVAAQNPRQPLLHNHKNCLREPFR